MRMQDIRKKSDADLTKSLGELRESVRSLRFRIAAKEIKNHQQLKGVRKDIARVLTILKDRNAR